MADNRIYMKCAVCGETLFLGKSHYEGAFYANYDNDMPLEDKLNAFYEKHKHLDGSDDYNPLGTNFYIGHERFSDEHNNAIRQLYLFDC